MHGLKRFVSIPYLQVKLSGGVAEEVIVQLECYMSFRLQHHLWQEWVNINESIYVGGFIDLPFY